MKTLMSGLLGLLVVTLAHASAEAACGTFEVAKGDVKVQSGAKVSAATSGSKICSGDTVTAGDQARAKIKMEDGNELNIAPNSKITLETYQYDAAQNKKKVLLNVLKGKIRATTREENMYNDKAKDGQANTFQVKTKSAVAGVRGTDFLTTFDPSNGKSEIITFRGKVDVGRLGPGGTILNAVSVGVGQTTVVLMGQAPATPKALPVIELKKMDTESVSPSTGASTTPPAASTAAVEPKEKREPANSNTLPAPSSMATGNELSGNTVRERGPDSMEMKRPPGPPVAVPTPPQARLPQQVIDAVQKKTLLRINVTY